MADDGLMQSSKAVKAIIDEVTEIQSGVAARTNRAERLGKVIEKYFNMAYLARSSVGPIWRSLDDAQKGEYFFEYKQVAVRRYARIFLDLKLEDFDFQFGSAYRNGRDILVPVNVMPHQDTEVDKRYSDKNSVLFRFREYNGVYKVIDLSLDGLSVIEADRSRYASIYASSGAEGLIEYVRNLPA